LVYTPRPQLGTKHACAACAVKFYDLGRSPVLCPVCGAAQPPRRPPAARLPPGRRWGATTPKRPEVVEEAAALLEPADAEDADEADPDDGDPPEDTEIDLPDDAGAV
jgi:uncharacterized protein (TIGR02300 family)